VVEYGYVSVRRRDVVDKEEVLGRLNVWSLDDDKQAAALVPLLIQSAHPTPPPPPTPSTPAHAAATPSAVAPSAASSSSSSSAGPSAAYTAYSTTAFVVCLDLSDPSRLSEQLSRWQQCLLTIRDATFNHMNKTERATLLHNISLHTQSYYNKDLLTTPPSSSQTEGTEAAVVATEVNPHVPEVNYGATVIVVGTKADVLLGGSGGGGEVRSGAAGGLSGDERLEFVVWLMRHAALQSASTLYLSALPSSASSTIDTLQSYLYHRLYHFPLSSAASTPQPLPAVLPQPTFVPAGYDSVELIEASQVKEGRWKTGMRSDEVFEKRRSELGGAAGRWREKGGAVVRSVDDSVLFKNIKAQLESGNSSVPLLPPLSASTSSTTPTTTTASHKPRLSAIAASTTDSPTGSHPSSPTGSSSSASRSKKNKLNPQGQVAVKAFFKSLLQQPGGSGTSSTTGGSTAAGGGSGGGGSEVSSKRSSMRKDAEMELKRISEAAAAGRAEKDKADRGEQKE